VGAAVVALVGVAVAVAAILHDDGSDGDGQVAGANGGSQKLAHRSAGSGWLPPGRKPRTVVWAIGDGADGGSASASVATLVASHRVDRFLYLGDVYETGTAHEFDVNYRPVYSRFDAVAAPTIGNHEWANVATGYVPYWTAARGVPPPFWYAFSASGWQLISLNSNAPASTSSGQLGWLAAKIRRTPRFGNCRIAFDHHPFFSAGLHGDTASLQQIFSELRGHATIVLSGHDHDMQRLHPVNGITQLVEGAGGRELYPVNRDDPRLAFFDDTRHGALRIRLRPGRAVVSFLAEDGSLLDRSAVGCSQG
jgi:calcineurin-like phosphoesterase family protein